jgi:DNA ligase-1
MKQFKPMLAYTISDTSKINYPCFVSIKLDGIRVTIIDGVVMSRSMKPIRSKVVQELFGRTEYNGLDGELLYGDWNAPNVFNLTTQAVMSTELKAGFIKSEITLAVFDDVSVEEGFTYRYQSIQKRITGNSLVTPLTQHIVANEQELLDFEKRTLNLGYEGIMARSLYGNYKQGRSTYNEGLIGKLKRFSDDEAVVIDFEEKMTNTNEKLTNELGYSQRSQSQEGMVGANTLGALVCTCNGITFTMGSGFDDVGRDEVWNNKEKYLGKLAKFKYFAIGMKDSYRFPIFLGWRDEEDMS